MTAAASIAACALVAAPAFTPGAVPERAGAGAGIGAVPVLSAPVAAAHSTVVETSPEADATLEQAPQEVRATFNEEISPEFAHLTVMLDGTDHAAGEPQVEGRDISVPVGELEPGTYTVGYRVVSADGHPVQGSWTFTLGGAAGAGGAGESAAAEQPGDAEQAEAPAEEQGSMVPAMAMLAVLAVALIGGAFFLLRRQRKVTEQYQQDFS